MFSQSLWLVSHYRKQALCLDRLLRFRMLYRISGARANIVLYHLLRRQRQALHTEFDCGFVSPILIMKSVYVRFINKIVHKARSHPRSTQTTKQDIKCILSTLFNDNFCLSVCSALATTNRVE